MITRTSVTLTTEFPRQVGTHLGVYVMNANTTLRVFIASFAWKVSTKPLKRTSITRRYVFPATATLMERNGGTPPVSAWSKRGPTRLLVSATVRPMSEDASVTIVHQVTGTLPLKTPTDASSAPVTSTAQSSRPMEAATRILGTAPAKETSPELETATSALTNITACQSPIHTDVRHATVIQVEPT